MGFIGWKSARRDSNGRGRARSVPHSIAAALFVALAASAAHATDVSVVGLFPGKAVVVVNGGAPRTIGVGAKTVEGVKLVAVEDGAAVLEFDGRRQRVAIGEQAVSSVSSDARPSEVTLTADGKGHFVTAGSVNGSSVRFVVDTGATLVSLSASDAVRAGIDYHKGEPAMAMTANGLTRIWRVRLDQVKVGEITLHDVDAAVHAQDMPALLGMSFLNRMEMKRDGDTMTLRRRY
jgi:aspartyl protease family protein